MNKLGRPVEIDLTGRRCGHLLVLGRSPPPPGKVGTFWAVRCDCGTERPVRGCLLLAGKTRSCGCLRRKASREACQARNHPRVDLTGQRFGRDLVIGHTRTADGKSRWQVRCDCGAERIWKTQDMLRSKGTGCRACSDTTKGEPLRIDMVGKQFARLTVMSEAPKRAEKGRWWYCLCACGETSIVNGVALRSGATVSCGCAATERIALRPERLRARTAIRDKHRRATDLQFTITNRMRCRLREVLKKAGLLKARRWEQIVGYSVSELVGHLATTMPPGYGWGDLLSGALHIDHVKPLAAFRYTSLGDAAFLEAWSLTNLQLLPAKENLLKNSRYSPPSNALASASTAARNDSSASGRT